MGQVFKIVGLIAVAGFLFGGKLTDELFERIEYSFDKLRPGDIRFDLRRGKLVGLLSLRFHFKQRFGVNETLKGLKLSFRQQGVLLGVLDMYEPVVIPHDQMVDVPVTLVVPAGPFMARLQEITKPGNLASAFAPIEISGAAYLASGITIPVHHSLNFLSIG